jgi:predicted HTH domain antitoxin
MPKIVSSELFEDGLEAVIRAGGYASKQEAVGHALEVLLAANPDLRRRTAIELYRHSKVTLSRAMEIADLELEAFKKALADNHVPIRVDEAPDDVRRGAEQVHRLRGTP